MCLVGSGLDARSKKKLVASISLCAVNVDLLEQPPNVKLVVIIN